MAQFSVRGSVYVYVAIEPPQVTAWQAARLANRKLATIADVEQGFDVDATVTRADQYAEGGAGTEPSGPIVGLNTVVTVSVDVEAADAEAAIDAALEQLNRVADTGGGLGFEEAEVYDAEGELVDDGDGEIVW